MKKYTLLLITLLLLTACAPDPSDFKSIVPVSRPSLEDRAVDAEPAGEADETRPEELPEAINLDVPFFAQAPEADWSYPWQEACEEASITLAYHYFAGTDLSLQQFKKNILDLVDWQNEHYGNYWHTTIDQTAEMLEAYFGFTDYHIIDEPTVDDLKRELAKGHLIVAPFAGRELENPFYSGEGPYYHMLVIKGYDAKNFITNDVGTKRGKDFIYPYQRMMDALHDYHVWDIKNSAKKVLVLE